MKLDNWEELCMVKSKIKSTIVLGICLTMLTSTVAFGVKDIRVFKDDLVVPIACHENKINNEDRSVAVIIDGKRIELDAKPFIENNHTLMPLFAVLENLGVEVELDDEKEVIKINQEHIIIELTIGKNTARVLRNITGTLKEEIIKLGVKPKVVDDDIFIPGRFVVETLGAEVDWDNSLRAMIIKTKNINEIENLVRNFGEKLQLVSLLAPKDMASKSIEENYSEFISYSLLEKWKSGPENAPGRITSSPWPDRIEIKDIKKVSEDKYQIKGEIIEVTSVEKATGGSAAKQAVTIFVVKNNDRWFIDEFKESIVYKNTEYSFEFYLPESWEGNYIKESQDDNHEVGSMVSIRHPNGLQKINDKIYQ